MDTEYAENTEKTLMNYVREMRPKFACSVGGSAPDETRCHYSQESFYGN
jgi:hypothetical protein